MNCRTLLFLIICTYVILSSSLKPPAFDNELLFKKMNTTGMFIQKIQEFLKIFADRDMEIYQQRDVAKAFIAALKNAKVKQATQKIFDEMKNAQNFAWTALNKTEEKLGPLLGSPISEVQQELDRACTEAKGNFPRCLSTVVRTIALEAAHESGKNKTKTALTQLLDWERQQKAALEKMLKFFQS
ncbi:hypothetical protein ANCCAN_04505 [Ancylostoma caninum]|uniref:SXP/RAL-2 family protein Ani s 5-like cation-binding domain-containing protein n=1 Tax=Ancylostoma caninum TaxID=29170 RepID=A0A368H2C8_ANCCA|nr:hypothetical protein ANCCAN_04505 [Ancylostoma caninum]